MLMRLPSGCLLMPAKVADGIRMPFFGNVISMLALCG
jgi:hypothetical protein